MQRLLLPKLLTALLCLAVFTPSGFSQTRFLGFGSSWKYLDNNTRPTGWETVDFNDATWASGNGELGYGDGDETTLLSYGPSSSSKYITTYFRKEVDIPNPSNFSDFTFNVERDDGIVIYVNGVEVARNNMAAGPVGHGSFASAVADDEIISITVPASAFTASYNIIAVELHQVNLGSSDISFDMELIGNTSGSNQFISDDDSWRYFDGNSRPANWNTTAFDDGLWKIGYGELGFGEGDEQTTIDGGASGNRYPSIYFRKKFTVIDPSAYMAFTFSVWRDDGFVIYLNGSEIGRNNMPAGTIAHSTWATANVEEEKITITIPASQLLSGENVVAVEMHQNNANSTDLSFNAKLEAVQGPKRYLQFGSEWRYLDDNTRPEGWETTAFDDISWPSGNGELGYGDGDETTILNYGGDAANKFVTSYFRTWVDIPNPGEFPVYTFNIERDDAFVVYVNGVEVGRNNMPAGPPTHGSFASAVEDDEIVQINVPAAAFVAGSNLIAVEVHQVNLGSSDLSFDMEIVGNNSPDVLIQEGSSWRYWDKNTRPSNWQTVAFDDGLWRLGYGQLGFGDGDEITVVDGGPSNARYPTIYFRKSIQIDNVSAYTGFTFNVLRDDGFVLYVNGTIVGRDNITSGTVSHTTLATSGIEQEWIPVVVPASNFVTGKNVIAVEMHQNSATSSDLTFDLQLLGASTVPPAISYGSSWKYFDLGSRPANWEGVAFDDASWATGNGELGYGDGGEATLVSYGGDANNKYPTTYFRKTFTVADPAAFANFQLNLIRDDGAVIYLNGVEIVRSNMPAGVIGNGSFASSNIAGTAETTPISYSIPTSYFLSGNNVIAVEVHQDDVSSSDLSFDLELKGVGTAPANPVVLAANEQWKYLDDGSNQGSSWKNPAFDDAAWKTGAGKLGYGGDGENTVIGYGPDANNKYPTTYFRKQLVIANAAQYNSYIFNLVRDDGAVVYVNGQEVGRSNMAAGVPGYQTYSNATVSDADETTPVSFTVPASAFVDGINTIAVEMHQVNATSSDLGFSLEILGSQQSAGGTSLTRSPYLQVGSQTGITIRWRTNIASNSRVELGTSPGNFTILVDDAAMTTEHEIPVSGLTPDTKYYYRIGTSTQVLQAGTDNFFTTVPAAGSRKVRIAAFGDCGRNENNFQANTLAQYRNYLSSNGIDAADAWILMGDNAYNSGTEAEYNSNFFSVYGSSILKNHKLYPSPGNHDYANSDSRKDDKNVPYFNLFSMPTQGEAGGVASNSKAFYSFDIGDIHFLSLDSYGEEANLAMYDTTGPQVSWIKADLAANTRKWVVAYWHHPPYTKGSHNSDGEGDLINIRENFIRILENHGVDLIICGHSHVYERSYLLQGYYKANAGDPALMEADFNPAQHTASQSTAKYDGSANSCPYVYQYGKYRHGTVYVVSGNAGADGGTSAGYPHNALPFSEDVLGGMFYFEADSSRLDAKYIRSDGAIGDQFTIMHDANIADTLFIAAGNEVVLNASWTGGYAWNTAAVTRTITVTPAEGKNVYSVVDPQACLKDSFVVYANICSGNINTWVGNVSTNWEEPGNWSCGVVPGVNSDVMVNPGTPFGAVVSSNVSIHSITIKAGASVTVKSGFKLEVKEP